MRLGGAGPGGCGHDFGLPRMAVGHQGSGTGPCGTSWSRGAAMAPKCFARGSLSPSLLASLSLSGHFLPHLLFSELGLWGLACMWPRAVTWKWNAQHLFPGSEFNESAIFRPAERAASGPTPPPGLWQLLPPSPDPRRGSPVPPEETPSCSFWLSLCSLPAVCPSARSPPTPPPIQASVSPPTG